MIKILKSLSILMGLLLYINSAFAEKSVNVVYPDWFKNSFYDLPGDLQDARDAGKSGIMVFVTMKSCTYCKAIIETTFKQPDIVKRLRARYDVIGLEVFSDTEVISMEGKSYWAKDFAVYAKAIFTPTMLFYDINGNTELRLVGYQSPKKLRGVLDYLERGHPARMKLSDFFNQHKPITTTRKMPLLDLKRRRASNRSLLVVVESTDCSKCQQLRTMLKMTMLQSYIQRFDLVYVNSTDIASRIITPDGKKNDGKRWIKQLGLIHSPAMMFYNEQGKEVLRIDTDILVDQYGKNVSETDTHILSNIRAYLQFVLDKGYKTMPQFQRWRAQREREKLK